MSNQLTSPAAAMAAGALDRDSSEPLYRQLAGVIDYRITVGLLKAGERLPTEAQLAQAFGVGRVTVRQAVAALARAGRVAAQQGKGTFVRVNLAAVEQDRIGLPTDGVANGNETSRTVRLNFFGPASDVRVAALPPALELPVLHELVYALHDEVYALTQSWMPQTLAAALHDHRRATLSQLSAHQLLRRYVGIKAADSRVLLRVATASRRIAKLMQIEPGAPLLMSERTSECAQGQICEYQRLYVLPDRFDLLIRIPAEIDLAGQLRQARGPSRAAG